EAETPAADGQDPLKKRRRGSRGGRGRKKKTTAGSSDGTAADDRAAAESEQKPAERRSRDRQRPPRRAAQRRAPLPKAKRELLISVDPGEKRVAVVEDGVVAEVYLERPEERSIAGNIYLGTVDNVL